MINFLFAFSETTQHTRDHMKRTEHSERHREICPARVISVKNLSPTVKGVLLHLNDSDRQATSFLVNKCFVRFSAQNHTIKKL